MDASAANSAPIIIEPIREDHVDGFRAALDIVARERAYLIFLEAPSIERMRDFVRDNIAAGHPHLVAVSEGRVIGWCDIRSKEREAQAHCGMLGIGIIPGYREQGLGTRLITAALAAAKAAGMHRVELDVHADNQRATALYEKVGFVREGVARDAVRIDGRFIDSLRMAMILT